MSIPGDAKSRMERILRLHEEIDEIKSDIRDIYAEEKSAGGDKTAMGNAISIIRKRAKDKDAFDEREALTDVYLNAYRAPSHTHAPARTRESIDPATGEILQSDREHDVPVVHAPVESAAGIISTPIQLGTATEVRQDVKAQDVPDVAQQETAIADAPILTDGNSSDGGDHAPAGESPASNSDPRPTSSPVEDMAGDPQDGNEVVSGSPAAQFDNPRCQHPDTCTFAHSRDCCFECSMAWADRPKDEQVRLWQEAIEAAA